MKFHSWIGLLFFATTCSLSAQVMQDDPLQRRANDVCSIVSKKQLKFDTVFTASFIKQVPPMQLAMGVNQLTAQTGACVGIKITKRTNNTVAKGEISTVNGYSIPFDLTIEPGPPYLIAGLFLHSPEKSGGDLSSTLEEFKKLKGAKSLCVVNLTHGKVVASLDTALSLPIGSAFKLYVLGELTRSCIAGEHRWDEVIKLDAKRISLPSGVTQKWPIGSPITLHTLATEMISISDNTATDHLLLHLGRKKVEDHQKVMGHHDPSLNAPFLTTFNMFVLKNTSSKTREIENSKTRELENSKSHAFLKMSRDERRKLVESIDSWTSQEGPRPSKPEDFFFNSIPVLVDSIEWFATTPDLCRAMDWIRRTSSQQNAKPMLEILGVNPGLNIDEDAFPVIAYKGGSEPGVLNMTFLLQRKDTEWFAVSASWMDKEEEVDLAQFSSLVTQFISALK